MIVRVLARILWSAGALARALLADGPRGVAVGLLGQVLDALVGCALRALPAVRAWRDQRAAHAAHAAAGSPAAGVGFALVLQVLADVLITAGALGRALLAIADAIVVLGQVFGAAPVSVTPGAQDAALGAGILDVAAPGPVAIAISAPGVRGAIIVEILAIRLEAAGVFGGALFAGVAPGDLGEVHGAGPGRARGALVAAFGAVRDVATGARTVAVAGSTPVSNLAFILEILVVGLHPAGPLRDALLTRVGAVGVAGERGLACPGSVALGAQVALRPAVLEGARATAVARSGAAARLRGAVVVEVLAIGGVDACARRALLAEARAFAVLGVVVDAGTGDALLAGAAVAEVLDRAVGRRALRRLTGHAGVGRIRRPFEHADVVDDAAHIHRGLADVGHIAGLAGAGQAVEVTGRAVAQRVVHAVAAPAALVVGAGVRVHGVTQAGLVGSAVDEEVGRARIALLALIVRVRLVRVVAVIADLALVGEQRPLALAGVGIARLTGLVGVRNPGRVADPLDNAGVLGRRVHVAALTGQAGVDGAGEPVVVAGGPVLDGAEVALAHSGLTGLALVGPTLLRSRGVADRANVAMRRLDRARVADAGEALVDRAGDVVGRACGPIALVLRAARVDGRRQRRALRVLALVGGRAASRPGGDADPRLAGVHRTTVRVEVADRGRIRLVAPHLGGRGVA